MKKTALLWAGLAALALSSAANAALLQGGFSLAAVGVPPGGSPVLPVDSMGNVLPNFDGATAIDFTTSGGPSPGVAGDFAVTGTSGDFNLFNGNLGTVQDFSFIDTGSLDFPFPPIAGFELFAGGLVFDLETISVVFQDTFFISLEGRGTFTAPGFDPTPGVFRFSAQDAGMNFSFSASQASVPEPAPLALIGLGIVAMGLRRRSLAARA
ncbi:MAG: PEP-CTERM sorting domain-containing protein [Pseudomonadota bacterium]